MEASDPHCTHLVVEDSVKELPSGLLEQSHCQAVKQEVSFKTESSRKLSNFNFQWTKTLYHSMKRK